MSQLQIIKKQLTSRAIREKVGDIKGNLRYLDLRNPMVRPESKNFIQKIGDLFNNMKGFISAGLPILNLLGGGFSNALGWLRDRTLQLFTFDWAQSDAALEALIESEKTRIFTSWGGALGRLLGWTVSISVGYGISLVIPVIGGATLANSIASKALKEGSQEVLQGIGGAIAQTAGAMGNSGLISAYINWRKAFNGGKATASSETNMSYASRYERTIENIKDKNWRAFFDALGEEAGESFWEGGMIIAHELDDAYAQAKQAQENARGKKRTVKLTPDKRRKGETMILSGSQKDLEEDILSTLNNYRLIANRDVGQIVGQAAEDYLSAKPLRRQLTLTFRTKAEPPWKMPDGKRAKEYTVTIPDVSLGLTWQKIKLAAKSYNWGKFRATAHLDNGRQMAVYGASKAEAERTLRRLAALSTSKILALNVTEEVEKKNINLRKDAKTVYPAYATLLVRRPTTGEGKNFTDNTKMAEELIRLDLWPKTQPPNLEPLK